MHLDKITDGGGIRGSGRKLVPDLTDLYHQGREILPLTVVRCQAFCFFLQGFCGNDDHRRKLRAMQVLVGDAADKTRQGHLRRHESNMLADAGRVVAKPPRTATHRRNDDRLKRICYIPKLKAGRCCSKDIFCQGSGTDAVQMAKG